jgi:hypothetical protein
VRSFQVFAAMSPEQAVSFFGRVKKEAPAYFTQSLHAASIALKSRPAFLLKQPFEKQVGSVRSALSRVSSNPLADETLAVYFLEVRKELLVEWLDTAKVAHDDGALEDDEPPQPEEASLREAITSFRTASEDADRELLLQAFSAQSAVDWPVLDELIAEALSA